MHSDHVPFCLALLYVALFWFWISFYRAHQVLGCIILRPLYSATRVDSSEMNFWSFDVRDYVNVNVNDTIYDICGSGIEPRRQQIMSFLNLKGTYEAMNLDWDIMTGQFKTGAILIRIKCNFSTFYCVFIT